MKNLADILKTLAAHKEELQQRYRVKELGVFGSVVRGEQKGTSDVDILVEFEKPIGFFTFLELEDYLSTLLGVKVDLVSKKALKPNIGRHILQEVILV